MFPPEQINELNASSYNVSELEQLNDATVLTSQMSPDELTTIEDVLNTEALIETSRQESFNIWEIVKKGAINLVLPFINGLMLGFGEILAHEIGYKYNWRGAQITPARRKVQESKYL